MSETIYEIPSYILHYPSSIVRQQRCPRTARDYRGAATREGLHSAGRARQVRESLARREDSSVCAFACSVSVACRNFIVFRRSWCLTAVVRRVASSPLPVGAF